MPWSLVSGCSVTSRAWTQASFSVFNLAIKSLMCSCRSRSCKMSFSSRRLCASSVGPKRRDTICIWIVFEVQLKHMHAGTVHILHWVKWLNASKLKIEKRFHHGHCQSHHAVSLLVDDAPLVGFLTSKSMGGNARMKLYWQTTSLYIYICITLVKFKIKPRHTSLHRLFSAHSPGGYLRVKISKQRGLRSLDAVCN